MKSLLKRSFCLLLAAVLLICLIPANAFAGLFDCNHKATTHVDAKASTCTSQGNIEYWQCNNPLCLKKFSDKQCTNNVSEVKLPIDSTNHGEYVLTNFGDYHQLACERCKALKPDTNSEAHSYTWTDNIVSHKGECSCGAESSHWADMHYVKVDEETHKHVCAICELPSLVNPTGKHDWEDGAPVERGDGTVYIPQTCKICSATKEKDINYSTLSYGTNVTGPDKFTKDSTTLTIVATPSKSLGRYASKIEIKSGSKVVWSSEDHEIDSVLDSDGKLTCTVNTSDLKIGYTYKVSADFDSFKISASNVSVNREASTSGLDVNTLKDAILANVSTTPYVDHGNLIIKYEKSPLNYVDLDPSFPSEDGTVNIIVSYTFNGIPYSDTAKVTVSDNRSTSYITTNKDVFIDRDELTGKTKAEINALVFDAVVSSANPYALTSADVEIQYLSGTDGWHHLDHQFKDLELVLNHNFGSLSTEEIKITYVDPTNNYKPCECLATISFAKLSITNATIQTWDWKTARELEAKIVEAVTPTVTTSSNKIITDPSKVTVYFKDGSNYELLTDLNDSDFKTAGKNIEICVTHLYNGVKLLRAYGTITTADGRSVADFTGPETLSLNNQKDFEEQILDAVIVSGISKSDLDIIGFNPLTLKEQDVTVKFAGNDTYKPKSITIKVTIYPIVIKLGTYSNGDVVVGLDKNPTSVYILPKSIATVTLNADNGYYISKITVEGANTSERNPKTTIDIFTINGENYDTTNGPVELLVTPVFTKATLTLKDDEVNIPATWEDFDVQSVAYAIFEKIYERSSPKTFTKDDLELYSILESTPGKIYLEVKTGDKFTNIGYGQYLSDNVGKLFSGSNAGNDVEVQLLYKFNNEYISARKTVRIYDDRLIPVITGFNADIEYIDDLDTLFTSRDKLLEKAVDSIILYPQGEGANAGKPDFKAAADKIKTIENIKTDSNVVLEYQNALGSWTEIKGDISLALLFKLDGKVYVRITYKNTQDNQEASETFQLKAVDARQKVVLVADNADPSDSSLIKTTYNGNNQPITVKAYGEKDTERKTELKTPAKTYLYTSNDPITNPYLDILDIGPVNAGTYTVTVTYPGMKGYHTAIKKFTLKIDQAELGLALANQSIKYSGNIAKYNAAADGAVAVTGLIGEDKLASEVFFRYFYDAECTKIATPINAGEYYVKGYITAEKNYKDVVSEAVKFTILPSVTITDVKGNSWNYEANDVSGKFDLKTATGEKLEAAGIYSIMVEYGDKTELFKLTIDKDGKSDISKEPSIKKNIHLEVESKVSNVNAAVSGMGSAAEKLATENKVDLDNNKIDLVLSLKNTLAEEKAKFNISANDKISKFYDIDVDMIVTPLVLHGETKAETTPVHNTLTVLEITIPMEVDVPAGKIPVVQRLHTVDGKDSIATFRQLSARPVNPQDGTYLIENDQLVIFSQYFSTYRVSYKNRPTSGGSTKTVQKECPKDNTCPLASYNDLVTTAWYHDGIHYCLEKGYMNGIKTNEFAPLGTTTRAQVVTILWRIAGSPVVNYSMTFEDLTKDWYREAVRWAASEKIVEGFNETTFGPSVAITREQLATILCKFAKYNGEDVAKATENTNTLSYEDIFTVSDWATEGVHWCLASKIIAGNNGKVLPLDNATRAEVATMIQRFCTRK